MEHPVYDIIGRYGLYAVFFLAMIEGDITLLLAGVLAHSGFFGDYSFAKVLAAGTMGGVVGDNLAYATGRGARNRVRTFQFYRLAKPRLERLTQRFGPLSIFLSKYIYGLRTASCVFYGIGKMRYLRFLPLTICSVFMWVFLLSGAGYFFSGTVTRVIGDYHQLGFVLLIIVVIGIIGFYMFERHWIGKKVEEASPDRIHELEHVAQEKFQVFREELHDRIHPGAKSARRRRREAKRNGP
jgi:membrane protein DedA with SNARE-associated domain